MPAQYQLYVYAHDVCIQWVWIGVHLCLHFLAQVPAPESSDLIDLFDIQDLSHSDIDEGDMYPSLLELSMDHNSPALGSPCDDLIPITTSCNEFGDFGIVLRHFTVLANIPVSCCYVS